MKEFEIAAGTTVGRNHRLVGRNNQDSFSIVRNKDLIISTVTDGCSSSPFAEVGSTLGATILNKIIEREFLYWRSKPDKASVCMDWTGFSEAVRESLLSEIRTFAYSTGLPMKEAIYRYFLFTFISCIVTPQMTYVIGIGDGVYAHNEEIVEIDEFPGNKPPYVAYGLLDGVYPDENSLYICTHLVASTSDVASILIGSDGLSYLMAAQDKLIPGKQDIVGELSQFWESDQYFENPDAIRRKLFLLNRDVTQIHETENRLVKSNGHLKDDTTLVSIRRRKEA